MIGIIDYKLGNLANVFHAVNKAGYRAVISDEFSVLRKCSGLILPASAPSKTASTPLTNAHDRLFKRLIRRGKYLWAFVWHAAPLRKVTKTASERISYCAAILFALKASKVPHMGWNSLHHHQTDALTENIRESDYVYFVHSYYARVPDFDEVLMYADYGGRFPAVVRKDNVIGMQFHPEKSALAGKILLENYLRIQT